MKSWRKRCLLLYMMRVPLIFLAVLGIGLPFAFQSSTFHGVADLRLYQVAWAALLAFLLVSSSITGCFLMLLYGEERADGWEERPAPQDRVTVWSVTLLYVYGGICYVIFLVSIYEFMKTAEQDTSSFGRAFLLYSFVGLLAAIAIVMIFFLGALRLAKPEDDDALEVFAFPAFFAIRRIFGGTWIRTLKGGTRSEAKSGTYAAHDDRVSTFLASWLGPGYASPATAGQPSILHSGHRFSAIVIIIFLVLYWLSGKHTFGQLSNSNPWDAAGPPNTVLNYLLLVFIFWNCVLTAITFFVDRFRVPALAALAAILGLISLFGSSDHFFLTVERDSSAPPLWSPADTFQSKKDSLIVVAAAGGGIQSAAWTSAILCGLRHDLPPEIFQDKILAISSVSGGSVGTMFYLRCLEGPANDESPAKWAQNSSLEAVAWGLTHPDLRRIFIPGSETSPSMADRGWALERSLLKSANFGHPMRGLVNYGPKSNWPVILFNSTDAWTGDPVVFTNSQYLGNNNRAASAHHYLRSFHQEYPGRDVLVETAARMSAAFPYVSPESRPDSPADGVHLGDGGYFDNSGVFTLAEWLKEAVKPSNSAPSPAGLPIGSKQKILILQLDAFPDTQIEDHEKQKKWYYQIASPITTMLRVRSEGQLIRDDTAGEDLQKLLNASGYQTAWLLVRYDPPSAAEMSSIDCPTDPPLSWHLTAHERSCIDRAWNFVRATVGATISEFMTSPPEAPSAACDIKPTEIAAGVFERQCSTNVNHGKH